jgi:hypothetical protein
LTAAKHASQAAHVFELFSEHGEQGATSHRDSCRADRREHHRWFESVRKPAGRVGSTVEGYSKVHLDVVVIVVNVIRVGWAHETGHELW